MHYRVNEVKFNSTSRTYSQYAVQVIWTVVNPLMPGGNKKVTHT